MSEITTRVDAFCEKHNMLCSGDFVVAGVSGGADSMLLLSYLLEKRESMGLRLLVANVEHGIRGEESLADTAFVEEFCRTNHVEFCSISINAVSESEKLGMGVEEYSRKRRYDFFHSFNPDKIATAHNLSDNVETLLFRLSRGTSIKGCCGIPAVRGNIIRPLLCCNSEEIRTACKEKNIPYRIDSTNSDNTYSRNYIRNVIVPEFKALNPSFETAVMRFIESVNEDEACIEAEADKCFDESFRKNCLILEQLNKFSPSVVKRAIIEFVQMYGISLDERHLSGVYALTRKQGRYQIKKNYFAISDKKRLRIAVFEEAVDFDDFVVNKKITSRADFLNNCELLRKEFDFYCDYDKIVGEIIFRARDHGDTISPAGRGCSKSLKKLYNELRINVEDRDSIPVICDDKGIIGVYGHCCDERVKIDNTTTSVLLLRVHTED